jgi:hypothetical protein
LERDTCGCRLPPGDAKRTGVNVLVLRGELCLLFCSGYFKPVPGAQKGCHGEPGSSSTDGTVYPAVQYLGALAGVGVTSGSQLSVPGGKEGERQQLSMGCHLFSQSIPPSRPPQHPGYLQRHGDTPGRLLLSWSGYRARVGPLIKRQRSLAGRSHWPNSEPGRLPLAAGMGGGRDWAWSKGLSPLI